MFGFGSIFIIAFATIFYKLAEVENASKLLWTSLSILFALASRMLPLGFIGLFLSQALLLFIITLLRFIPLKKSEKDSPNSS